MPNIISNGLKVIMPSRVFIHATNVHQGGGRSLLEALLKVLNDKVKFELSLDDRMTTPVDMPHNVQIKRVKPSILGRLSAERWLFKSVAEEDVVLCFGNLPPLFKLRGHTTVFVQNRYLIDEVKLNGFTPRIRLRLAMERLWLSKKMLNVNEFIVQTPTMKNLLELKTRGKVPVRVFPFVGETNGYSRAILQPKIQKKEKNSFVYVASGEPHKNHRQLIEAWCLLAKEEIFPSLYLTLDETRFSELCLWIELKRKQYGLRIINAGMLSHQDVLLLYKKSIAMIYPSTLESFGLPLIEARQAGLQILASELDYVRDVVDPEQTFNPESSRSIARAVKRHMEIDVESMPLLDATGFMASLLRKVV
jgi:glycosyltransferase involved in cell wall biosynthesis